MQIPASITRGELDTALMPLLHLLGLEHVSDIYDAPGLIFQPGSVAFTVPLGDRRENGRLADHFLRDFPQEGAGDTTVPVAVALVTVKVVHP